MGRPEDVQRQPDKQSERTVRRTLWVIGLFFGLPFALFSLWSGLAVQIWRVFFPVVYYSESFADITVDGQRYQLTSVARCEQRYTATVGGLVSGGTNHTVRGGLLVKRLPSGGGIIIKGPYLCSKLERKRLLKAEQDRTFPLSLLLTPGIERPNAQILRIDNVEDPTRIRLYKLQHFESSDGEIQIDRIGFRKTESHDLADPSDEIPWLRGRPIQMFGNCSKGEFGDWMGFYIDVVNEDVWSNNEGLSHLSDERKLRKIQFSEHTKGLWAKKKIYNIELKPADMLIKLLSFQDSTVGTVDYYHIKEFGKRNVYREFFSYVNSSSTIRHEGNWVYDPDNRIMVHLHMNKFVSRHLCR